jgi:hypothetical protein
MQRLDVELLLTLEFDEAHGGSIASASRSSFFWALT